MSTVKKSPRAWIVGAAVTVGLTAFLAPPIVWAQAGGDAAWIGMSNSAFVSAALSRLADWRRGELTRPEWEAYGAARNAEAAARVRAADVNLAEFSDGSEHLLYWAAQVIGREELEPLANDWLVNRDAVSRVSPAGVVRLVNYAGVTIPVDQMSGLLDGALPRLEDKEFVLVTKTTRVRRNSWEKERKAAFNQQRDAEAARRLAAFDGDLRGVAKEVGLLISWGRERLGEEAFSGVAADWLAQRDAAAVLPPAVVKQLVAAAGSSLAPEQLASIRQALSRETVELRELTLRQLRDYLSRMAVVSPGESRPPFMAQRREAIHAWAEAHDPSELDGESLAWVITEGLVVRLPRRRKVARHQVVWSGRITAPRSGEYTFSLNPHAVGKLFRNHKLSLSASVVVDGRLVVDAKPGQWKQTFTGAPVLLDGDRPTPIEVTFKQFRSGYSMAPVGLQLYWKGPGLARQIVAPSVFTRGPQEAGLSVSTEQRPDKEEPVTRQTECLSVDHVFCRTDMPADPELLADYAAAYLERCLSDEAFAGCRVAATEKAPETYLPPPLLRSEWPHDQLLLASATTSAQRKHCCERLLAYPEALGATPAHALVASYKTLRYGAEREAVEVVAGWMRENRNRPSPFHPGYENFIEHSRGAFRELAGCLAHEHPESLEWLEPSLESGDGICCLPAAYTLAYGYLITEKKKGIGAWIARLDERLGDGSLQGDARVNWLLARAMAEEIRHCPARRFISGRERLLAGMGWIDEAELVASGPLKERVQRERVARLLALSRFAEAEGALSAMPEAMKNRYQLAIEDHRQRGARRERVSDTRTERLYLAELERRRDAAAARGDERLRARYDSAIQAINEPASAE